MLGRGAFFFLVGGPLGIAVFLPATSPRRAGVVFFIFAPVDLLSDDNVRVFFSRRVELSFFFRPPSFFVARAMGLASCQPAFCCGDPLPLIPVGKGVWQVADR